MTGSFRPNYRDLGLAVGLPLGATVLQWLLWPSIHPFIWFLFHPAVFLAAWLTGRWGGLLATLLSAVLAVYVFSPPTLSTQVDNPSVFFSVLIFIIMGGLFSYALGAWQQANRRLDLLAQLQASEANLKRAEDVAHVGHWAWDVRSNQLSWSDEMYRIFGLNPIGFSGDLDEVVRTAIHPDDRQKVAQANAAVSEAGQPAPLEYRVVWPDGTVRTVYAEPAEQTRDEHGQTVRLWGIVQDITERKQAEATKRQWADAFEHCAHGMALAEAATNRLLACNVAFGRLHHCSPQELIGLPVFKLHVPDFHERIKGWLAESDRTGQVQFESRMVRQDGTTFPVQMDIVSVRDAAGQLLYRVATIQDITERKQIEEALKDSEQRFTTAFHISPVAQSIIAQGSNEVLAVNDTACRLFGYSREELIGASTAKLNLWQNPAERQAAVEELQATGHLTARETAIRTKSGEARTVLVAIEPITRQGRPSFITSLIDITERQQAEQRIKYLARLYATLSQVNQAIVRTTDQQELFEAICQIAVDYGEFKLAWIGLYDAGSGQVTPVADSGASTPEVFRQVFDLTREPLLSSTLAAAVFNDRVEVNNDVGQTVRSAPWRELAAQLGHHSSAAIPFHRQGQVVGVLNLYAADVNFFAVEEEQKLLAEMGLDISFALDTMQMDAQRQQILAALRDSEARSRALIEHAPDGIVLTAGDTFKYASPSALKMFGYQQAELFQRGPADLTHPEDLPQVVTVLTDVIQHPSHVSTLQYRFRHQDGSWRWIESTFSNLLAEPGVEAIVINFRDITERKQAEEALRLNEARYRTAQAIGHVGNWEYNLRTTQFWGSDEAKRIYGFDLQQPDFTTEEVENCIPERERVHQALIDLIEAGKPYNLEFEIHPKDSSQPRIITSLAQLRRDEHGRPLVVAGVIQDITERKQAEEAQRQSEEQYRFLVDNTSDFIARFDQAGVMVFASGAAYRFNGYLPEELIHTSAFERVHPDDQARVRNELERVLGGGGEGHVEYRVRRKSGDYFWVEGAGRRVANPAGEPEVIVVQRDITDRKRAEEKLRESEERLELVMQGSQLGYWDWNIETGEVYRNVRWAEMLGYTLEEINLTVNQWTDLHHPDDREAAWKSIQDHLAGKTSAHRVEYRMRAKDGQYKWILDQARIVKRTAQGKPLRMSGTHTDITDRKRAEAALRDSEKKYQDLLNGMNDTICVIDFDTRILDVNNAATLVLGYTRDELLSMKISDIDAELTAEQIQGLASSMPHDKLQVFETWHRTKDGRRLPVEVSSSLVSYLGRTVIMSIARDITERKQADEALRLSQENFAKAFDLNPAALVITRRADGKFVKINAAHTRLIGYQPVEIIGRLVGETTMYVNPGDRQAIVHLLQATGLIEDREILIRTKAGTVLTMLIYITPIRFDGEDCMLSALLDITERKQAEAQIQQINTELEQRVTQRTAQLAAANDRLLDLDRLKTKFVSDVSHELRTPVTSLSLYIDLLEHGKPEKREQYVGKLKEQMDRLRTLINDILDLSRLERDRDEGGRSPVDINSIVEHVTTTQLIAAETAGLSLTCEVADNLPAVVARPDQLTRAITNLVSNAIKYTPRGTVRVQTWAHAQRVCIEVADTGLGIPADELPHLFERFYRGRAVAQSTIPGTGLGLSIVKEIIESHGGTVDVTSELGRGSVFHIWLPFA